MTRAPALHIDFETRSAVDLKKAGAYRYSMDPSTEVICLSYRFDDGPVQRWRPGEPIPAFVTDFHGPIIAHNAGFERAIWNNTLLWPVLKPEHQDCTMARAQAVGLPGALFALANTLNIPDGKDMGGHALMMKMCRPRTLDPLTWWESPAEMETLQAYCDQDVRTECAVDAKLPPLTERERQVWLLDQTINDRGVKLDRQMIESALSVVDLITINANRRIWELTGGKVSKVTEAAKIVAWINSRGIPCESVAEGEHEELILCSWVFDDPAVEQVIKLRAASAKAFKFKAMADQMCDDGRVRGSLRYAATVQKRWAGAGVQFHNMKRVETEEDAVDVSLAVAVLKGKANAAEKAARLELLFDAPLEVLSICTRSTVIPAEGHTLIGGDYSNIEGRINAWLAGHKTKMDAFRAYDAGTGPDLYKVTAGNIIGITPEAVSKAQRQEQGKVPELACGFGGSLGAFKKMGAKYGVKLSDDRIRQIVRGWRDANAPIVEMWGVLQEAAIQAMQGRGAVVSVLGGRIQYVADKAFLYCRLPSGGVIHYPSPSLAWKSKKVMIDGDEVEFNRLTVSYWTQRAGKFRQEDLYGGAQTAHVVSGIAREVLVEAMLVAETEGYPLVLTVHDELLCEVPVGQGSADGLNKLMLRPIPWLGDCPISVSTWEGPRYAH